MPYPKKWSGEKTRAGEYVDFMELPPAKGKPRPNNHAVEGQILLVQAADLAQARKTIPTWLQCLALFVAVLISGQPERAARERVSEFMAYQSIIAKASGKCKWPSWVIYDRSFRQEVAGMVGQLWARVNPSIYSLCFSGQAIHSENWCSNCQSIDHMLQSCPPHPRSWSTAMGTEADT